MSSLSRPVDGHAAQPSDVHSVVRADEWVAPRAASNGGSTSPPHGSSHGSSHGGGPSGAQHPAVYAPQRPLPAWSTAYRTSESRWPDAVWSDARPQPTEEPVIDLGQLRELAGFPWRALKRRRRAAAAVFVIVVAVAAAVAAVSPRSYDALTTIMAQRNFVMPALGNPRRSVPMDADAPTRLASEAVLNRENLLAIISETGLEAAWPRMRTPLGQVKAAVRARLEGPVESEQQRDMLLHYLWSRLWVAVDDHGVIRIGVSLPDPQKAFEVVQVAERNFLKTRHASELSLIGESIGIIEGHVATTQAVIDSAMGDVRQFTPASRRGNAGGLVGQVGAAGAAPGAEGLRRSPAVAALEADAVAKRTMLTSTEGARAQRAGTLRTQLAELRNTLGPAHPDVVAAQQSLAALATEPPELTAMREDVRQAEARAVAAGGVANGRTPSEASLTSAALLRLATQMGDTIEDPRLTLAKSRLKMAVADYEDLLDRLEGARIEMETARAAFKHRYSVIAPPQLPRRPSRPNVPFLLIGGVCAGAGLAVFVALVLDLGSGRLIEGWQVSRFVGVRMIGETPPT